MVSFESKYFKINDLDLTRFTKKIIDVTEISDSPLVSELGSNRIAYGNADSPMRTITWIGRVSREKDYSNIRKEILNPVTKTINLSTHKEINIKSLTIEQIIDADKPEKNQVEISIIAADNLEYSTMASKTKKSITASSTTINIKNKGTAPTIPQWTLIAAGDLVNPTISLGTKSITYRGTIPKDSIFIISKTGAMTIDGVDAGQIADQLIYAEPANNAFVYTDDSTSSHKCNLSVAWNDAYY